MSAKYDNYALKDVFSILLMIKSISSCDDTTDMP